MGNNSLIVSGSTNLPTSSLTSSEKIQQAVAQFGEDYVNLIFCAHKTAMPIEKAAASYAPTMRNVSDFFSEKAILFWLRFHIAETFAFLGIYDTASKYQIQETANLILHDEIFGQLTLDEFLCFLHRFKTGHYGKIYQSARPNPQEFLACLTPFWNELWHMRGKAEDERKREEQQKMLRDPRNMTREEYDEIKQIEREYDIFVEYNRGKY